MIHSDTIISSTAFIAFVITNVFVFLFIAKNIVTFPASLFAVLTINFLIWMIHGYNAHDVSLMCSSGLGALTFGILLGARLNKKAKPS